MKISIAHLGPSGTNAETAALAYAHLLKSNTDREAILSPYTSIAQTLRAVAQKQTELAVVPVENSTEGAVAITLDTLWQLDGLQIQQELVLPISHALLSYGVALKDIKIVYSHPQALAQCQQWLETFVPSAQIMATNSTTEAIQLIHQEPTAAAIASPRAAKIYNFPVLVADINDYPDNCTRFWVVGRTPTTEGSRVSLGFSVPKNEPGALVNPLQVFAKRGLNLSRIESRPTKRSLGEYLFFVDIDTLPEQHLTGEAIAELSTYTEVIRVFGHYQVLKPQPSILTSI